MKALKRGWRRLLGTLSRRHNESELAAELASHIEMQIEDNLLAEACPPPKRCARLI